MRDMAVLLAAGLLASLGTASKLVSDCPCGFYDSSTRHLYTQSIITYFNETTSIPSDYYAETFEHRKEFGWNTLFRRGATPANIGIGNASEPAWLQNSDNPYSLELYVEPPTQEHLIVGSSIRSHRQDIRHGTFRASMRAAYPSTGGSVLSMMLWYNDSSVIQTDLLNTENAFSLIPEVPYGVNYSTITNGSTGNVPVPLGDFANIRMDWTDESIEFIVANNVTRSILAATTLLPDAPVSLIMQHWGTGDFNLVGEPDPGQAFANVAWIRSFFNSSLATDLETAAFDAQCDGKTLACSVDDLSLRGSSPYSPEATKSQKLPAQHGIFRVPAAFLASAAALFGFITLTNTFLRRTPWSKLGKGLIQKKKKTSQLHTQTHAEKMPTVNAVATTDFGAMYGLEKGKAMTTTTTANTSMVFSDTTTAVPWGRGDTQDQGKQPDVEFTDVSSPSTPWDRRSIADTLIGISAPVNSSIKPASSSALQSRAVSHRASNNSMRLRFSDPTPDAVPPTPKVPSWVSADHKSSSDDDPSSAARESITIPRPPQAIPLPQERVITPPAKRIDYLAGLLALSCICVTFIHFCQTFVPYVLQPKTGTMHYKSEILASYIAGPYLLTTIWVGPFFTISSRFLAQRFLTHGKLSDIASKMLLRAPRLLIPVAIVAALEYFLIEQGLVLSNLQYIPSITWSTNPFVEDYDNFGAFLNNVLDLGYVVPNVGPQIVYHYCTGVLWTIPVQLQFSYTTLFGAVMIRDVKTPWKRFSFYTFCIAAHWYAFSWGSCFWLGLMLADLEITYKLTARMRQRPWVHYPVLCFFVLLGLAAPTFVLSEDLLGVPMMTAEHNVHPDVYTGLPMGQTAASSYPNYFEPRLNTLMFALAAQMVVEMSTWVQWVLSLPVWVAIFPHIMSIYLIHGFVFWSLGAYLCVALFGAGLPYWACLLIIFVCCYATIGIVAVLLTPLTEKTAMAACRNMWRWASEEPVVKQPTLAPFPRGLFIDREGARAVPGDAEVGLGLTGVQKAEGKGKGSEQGLKREASVTVKEV